MPSAVSQCGDVTTERRVQGEECVLGRRGGGGGSDDGGGGWRELLACGLVHHRSGAISCNVHQLTQGNLRLTSGGGILPLSLTHKNANTNTCW